MSGYGLPLLIAAGAAFLARKPLMSAVQQLSANGLKLLTQHEGLRLQVYTDAAGYPTIGYGHKLLPGESFPGGITPQQAEAILFHDTGWAQNAVRSLVRVPINRNQFDALVSLVFNIGQNAFANSTLLELLNKGFYAAASEQFLVWKWAGGKPILLSRREREKMLFDTPEKIA